MKSKLVVPILLLAAFAGNAFAQQYDHREVDAHRAAADHRMHEHDERMREHDERMRRDAREDRKTHRDQMVDRHHDDHMGH